MYENTIRHFSGAQKTYFVPDDVKGKKLSLQDIHAAKDDLIKIKDPVTSKSDRRALKEGLLLRLSKSKFSNYIIDSPKDVQFFLKTSHEYRTFVTDFNILFATALRMPYRYFDKNITFETWIQVLEGREKRAKLNATHSNEISELARVRKETLARQNNELSAFLGGIDKVSQIDNLTIESLPIMTLNVIRSEKDEEKQAIKLREALMDFKANELAKYSVMGEGYVLPKSK